MPLSSRRLLILLVLLLLSGLLFFTYNLDNQFLSSADTNPWATFEPEAVLDAAAPESKPDRRYVVAGKPEDTRELAIKNQTLAVLDFLGLSYRTRDVLKANDLKLGETLIVIVSDLEQIYDPQDLAEFVRTGGDLILAAGLSPDYNKTFFDPLLGIRERGTFSEVKSLRFCEGTLPYPETDIIGLDAFMALNVRLQAAAQVLIETTDGMPLAWVHPYEDGQVGVMSGPMLENPVTAGFLIPVLGEVAGQLVYPIVNAKVVALDAAPPLFDSNDNLSFQYYGRSAESFVRDQLWNIFEQKAALLDLAYTTSFIGIDANPFKISQVNLQTFSFVNKQVLKLDGEIMLAGDHNGISELTEERVADLATFFRDSLPNYALRSYYPLYGTCDLQHLAAIRKEFPEIAILRYPLDFFASPAKQAVLDVLVKDAAITLFPTITDGFKVDRDSYLAYLSQLTLRGLVSHSFDVNYLFTVPEKDSNWNELDDAYDELCDQFFAPVRWLSSLTISPAASNLAATSQLMYTTQTTAGQITVTCQNFTPGQAFFIRSRTPVERATGATVQPINSTYSLVIAETPQFTLELSNTGGSADGKTSNS
ncbi:MAG: DUF2194 domain-containing protein [Eubacteriales bacterium]|nr:DUF2194 domain-containing protein [Eubacteriales bacterium]